MKTTSSLIILVLLQPGGRPSGGGGFIQWLIEFLIQPQFQSNPAAGQVASTVFWATGLAAAVFALFGFLCKMYWEKRVRRHGMRFAALGPSRTRVMMVVWYILFLVAYLALMFGIVSRPLALLGAGNLFKMAAIGSLIFVIFYILFHLTSEDYRRHLPWKRVK